MECRQCRVSSRSMYCDKCLLSSRVKERLNMEEEKICGANRKPSDVDSEREKGGEAAENWRRRRKGKMALVGVAAVVGLGSVGAALYSIRPRDPIFEVESIKLSGFNLRWSTESLVPIAVVDVSLTLNIKVTNPNVAPIQYTSTVMDIYYRGTLLGQATVEAGSQAARSQQVLEVPAKLDGLKMTNHLTDLLSDVTRREMTMHSVVTISGYAVVWRFKHPF